MGNDYKKKELIGGKYRQLLWKIKYEMLAIVNFCGERKWKESRCRAPITFVEYRV